MKYGGWALGWFCSGCKKRYGPLVRVGRHAYSPKQAIGSLCPKCGGRADTSHRVRALLQPRRVLWLLWKTNKITGWQTWEEAELLKEYA